MVGFSALIACLFLYLAQRDLAKRLRRAETALAQAGLIADPGKTDSPTDTAHGTHDPAMPDAAGGTPAPGANAPMDAPPDTAATAAASGAVSPETTDASIVDQARAAFDRAAAALAVAGRRFIGADDTPGPRGAAAPGTPATARNTPPRPAP